MARTRKQGGTVRRLKSGRWQALVDTDGKRVSIGGTFDTEQDALDGLRRAVVESDRGTFKPTRSAPLFEQYARREVRLRDIRPRTRQGYQSLLATMLLPHFGRRRLDQISIALLSGIAAIVLGIVGIARAGRIGARRGTAIAGLVIGSISAIGVAVAVAVTVANATTSSIDTSDLESQISDWVYEQAGQVVEVECPANPPASTGSSFSCTVLGGVEMSETVEVTVQDEQGTVTWHLAE